MKINDNELENLMKSSSIEPDSLWQQTALEKIKKSVTKTSFVGINNSNLNFISLHMFKRKVLAMSVLSFAMLSAVVVAGIYIFNLQTTRQRPTNSEILSLIAKNNPTYNQGNRAQTNSVGNLAPLAAEASFSSDSRRTSMPSLLPASEFNYTYSKSLYTRGPSFGACNYGIDQSNFVFVPRYESYSYFSEAGSYNKSLGFNEDGTINSYYLSKAETTSNLSRYETISYLGGTYAARTVDEFTFDPVLNTPMAEPRAIQEEVMPVEGDASVSSDVSILPFPGVDANIIGTRVFNGKEYYVMEYSYDMDCSGGAVNNLWDSNFQPQTRKMYVQNLADMETYEIVRTETYIDSVSDANLVDASENTFEQSNVDFASVASNFEFEFNVPIRDFTTQQVDAPVVEYDPEGEIQKSLNFAKDRNLSVLFATEGLTTDPYVYFNYYAFNTVAQPVISNTYYSDRAFFPQGSIGDKMFNSYNGVSSISLYTPSVQSLGSSSYSKGDSSYNINIYDSSLDQKDILNSMLWGELRNKNETATTVIINGEVVLATLYSYDVKQAYLSPAVDYVTGFPVDGVEGCEGDTCFQRQYILIFAYNNSLYAIQEYNYSSNVAAVDYDLTLDGTFRALNAGNPEDLSTIGEYMRSAFSSVEPMPLL